MKNSQKLDTDADFVSLNCDQTDLQPKKSGKRKNKAKKGQSEKSSESSKPKKKKKKKIQSGSADTSEAPVFFVDVSPDNSKANSLVRQSNMQQSSSVDQGAKGKKRKRNKASANILPSTNADKRPTDSTHGGPPPGVKTGSPVRENIAPEGSLSEKEIRKKKKKRKNESAAVSEQSTNGKQSPGEVLSTIKEPVSQPLAPLNEGEAKKKRKREKQNGVMEKSTTCDQPRTSPNVKADGAPSLQPDTVAVDQCQPTAIPQNKLEVGATLVDESVSPSTEKKRKKGC
ncbi:hypothetical protein CROQUDRAFT_561598 [Cronartium quercuum f. sp. fusiforme G11]|uniref:Uncharacterized protein n=1 Tax=Cronartium quercuum f. sp. fusiforme G11 TaxID=708437 RepID=A0A9P6TAW5_9BASI|nr:hypothetical protein CROQUDRAFT_561598 [Cronartium quercuum f. sp. fusiforme G11]